MSLPCWRIFLWIGLIIGGENICHSQNIDRNDSLEYHLQFDLFDDLVGIENTEVINGPKYTLALQVSGAHPFYISSRVTNGSLLFAGQPYFSVGLLYDIYSDELVIQSRRATGSNDLIVLNKENVESFRIYGHTFKHYRDGTAQDLGITSGFYDVLYDGSGFNLVVKRQKDTKVEMGRVLYEDANKYLFMLPGEKATRFRGMKNFYQVLADKEQRSELRSFVKKNNLVIRKREDHLIKAAGYCDSILSKGR